MQLDIVCAEEGLRRTIRFCTWSCQIKISGTFQFFTISKTAKSVKFDRYQMQFPEIITIQFLQVECLFYNKNFITIEAESGN